MTVARSRIRGAAPVLVPAALILLGPVAFDSFRLTTLISHAVILIVAIGFNVVFGWAGAMSFGHGAFALLGAYATAIANVRWEWGYLPSAALAVALCVVVGVTTALPTLRMSAHSIAVVTLLYLGALTSLITYFNDFTGGGTGVPALRLDIARETQWYLVATIAAVVWLALRNLSLSPTGRAWETGRIAPALAESFGVSVVRSKLGAMAVSAGLAGLGGTLFPMLRGYVYPDSFDLHFAIVVLVVVVIGGAGSITGPALGAAVVCAMTLFLSDSFASGGHLSEVAYGALVLGVMILAPGGATEVVTKAARRLRRRRDSAVRLPDQPDATIASRMGTVRPAHLLARGVSWQVGGLRILEDVDLDVRPGTIHGLIGPNGAGKTSLLNCICGFTTPTAGEVRLDEHVLAGPTWRRARGGLSRTFQHPALLGDRTVLENVLTAVDSSTRSNPLAYLLRLPAAIAAERRARREALEWLMVVGLGAVSDEPASNLTPGQRRQLDIVRAIATRPSVLLLDEPAAGLTDTEIKTVEGIIREVAACGVAIVLIEHHSDLVLRVCDRVTVLDAGRVIFDGLPADAAIDDQVIEAYLGGKPPVVPEVRDDELAVEVQR